MECRIPSTSVKNFIKSVTCLTKIGDSINFEITPSRFVLRTLGDGEAAYFQIDFSTKPGVFFELYNCYYLAEPDNNNNHNETQSVSTSLSEANRTIKARIKSKIFLSAFRLTDCARSVELKFKTELNKLEITSTFSYNICRKYSIYFEDIPTILQAEFDFNQHSIHELCCQSNTFKRVLSNFANSLAEITLILSEQELAMKSYIDTAEASSDSIQTICHLKRDQHFTKFNMNLPSSLTKIILTVVQKEFKAILTLCQSLNESIQMYLTFAGAPVLLTNTTPNHLRNNNNNNNNDTSSTGIHIKLIMATISDQDEVEMSVPSQQSNTTNTNTNRQHNDNNHNNHNNITPLAQPQVTPSQSQSQSRSNYNNGDSLSAHLDDDDVIIGLPTHGNFAEEQTDFFPVNTTQRITVQNESELQEDDHDGNNENKTHPANYQAMLQPHPDARSHSSRSRQSSNNNNNNNNNNGNNGNFGVNEAEYDRNRNKNKNMNMNRNRNRNISSREKKILPSSELGNGRDIINLIDESDNDNDNNINSLEAQYTVSDDTRSRNNRIINGGAGGGGSDYLSSYLDHMDEDYSMTPTQPVDGGQIANRFNRQRKRTMQQDHYRNNERESKRQRYNDNNKNGGYTSTLKKRPKSKWHESPDL